MPERFTNIRYVTRKSEQQRICLRKFRTINGVINAVTTRQSSKRRCRTVDLIIVITFLFSMWAIGVIIFVSLTGYFPFHEELDILPQLDNIPKLFQDDIFAHVTEDVKDLLKFRLLVPDAGHRMHSAGVIYHDWFQKSQKLFQSCRQLEDCLEKKWLTLFFEEPETTNPAFRTDEGSDSN